MDTMRRSRSTFALVILLASLTSTISRAAADAHVTGVVKAVSADSLNVETTNGGATSLAVTPKTKAVRDGARSTLKELTVGDSVVVDVRRNKAGGLDAEAVAWVTRPVRAVGFLVTTAPQKRYSPQLLLGPFDPGGRPTVNVEVTQPEIPLPEGSVFLLAKVELLGSPDTRGHTATRLIDSSGEVVSGLHKFGPLGWSSGSVTFDKPRKGEAPKTSYDTYLFAVKKGHVVGSVFRFLDAEFKVSDFPSEDPDHGGYVLPVTVGTPRR